MKLIHHTILTIISISMLLSCKKIPPVETKDGTLTIKINYEVDGSPLKFDSRIYTNAAGNSYEVNRLEYYLSNFVFHSSRLGNFTSNQIFYCNAKNTETAIRIANLPKGVYDYITFNIGLDTAHNHSYSLPNIDDNINMAWPDMMGGGYHFLKLEGSYSYNAGTSGFAMHLGRDTSLVNCNVNSSFLFGSSPFELNLSMNINEWFKNPHIFDFDADGNYIMGNNLAMRKIADNGADVFSIKK